LKFAGRIAFVEDYDLHFPGCGKARKAWRG
jgi:hypothetical protein